MENTKPFYMSKIVWMGIIQTLIGILTMTSEFLNKGSFQPVDMTLLVTGFLTIIMRIWFTDTIIQK